MWDGDAIAADVNGTNVTARYVRGLNLIYSDMSNTKKYYLYNGHGDVTGLADSTGSVVKSYTYDAFGNEQNPDAGDVNVFRYCGEYFDKETGTIYLRARYYNPGTGRFISEDSVRGKDNNPLSLNLYTYCQNDPIDFFDPSGNKSVMLRFAAEFNGAKVNWNGESGTVEVTIGNISKDYSGKVINGKMMIDSEYLSSDFNMPKEKFEIYKSTDDAAICFGWDYNPISIDEKREYAAEVYAKQVNGKTVYYTTDARHGSGMTAPWHTYKFTWDKLAGLLHTHGAWMYYLDESCEGGTINNDDFSWLDRDAGKETKVPVYLASPGGFLKRYDYNKYDYKHNWGETTLSNDMAKDWPYINFDSSNM